MVTARRARQRPLVIARAVQERPGFASARTLVKTSLVGDRVRWLALGDEGRILCGGDGLAEASFAPGTLAAAEVRAGTALVAQARRSLDGVRAEDPTPAWKEIPDVTLRLEGNDGSSFAMGFKTFEHGAPSLPEFMLQEAVEWLNTIAAAQALSR